MFLPQDPQWAVLRDALAVLVLLHLFRAVLNDGRFAFVKSFVAVAGCLSTSSQGFDYACHLQGFLFCLCFHKYLFKGGVLGLKGGGKLAGTEVRQERHGNGCCYVVYGNDLARKPHRLIHGATAWHACEDDFIPRLLLGPYVWA